MPASLATTVMVNINKHNDATTTQSKLPFISDLPDDETAFDLLVDFGVVAFTEINKYQGHASWAFYADPNAPRGTGSWMEVLALDFALIELGLNKLYCEVLSYNVGVINKHKKFGFEIEGVFVDQFKNKNGYADIIRLANFLSVWREKRTEIIEKLEKY